MLQQFMLITISALARLDQYGNPRQVPLQAPRSAYEPQAPVPQQQLQETPPVAPPQAPVQPLQPAAPLMQPVAPPPQFMADSDPAEAEAESPAPPERNLPIPRAPARDWSKIGNGDVSPRAGGNGFGSAGPTSAAAGMDETIEDYQKVKGECRLTCQTSQGPAMSPVVTRDCKH